MSKSALLPAIELPAENRLIREVYLDRKGRNPSYSTRAFARDLGISHAYACLLLTGKRKVPAKQAARLAALLKLDAIQSERFLAAVRVSLVGQVEANFSSSTRNPQFMELELDRFQTIQSWYHAALLDLVAMKNFQPDVKWIAKQLGIGAMEVRDAADRLERLGLLDRSGKRWTKTQAKLVFPTQKPDAAVRQFHGQMIDRAKAQLSKTKPAQFAAREISGMTMSLRKDRIEEAKRRIRQFQRDLAEFVCEGDPDGLYQLNVQFFSLIEG